MKKLKLTKNILGIVAVASLFTLLFFIFFKVILYSNRISIGREGSTYAEIKFFSQRTDKKDVLIELIKEFENTHPGIKVNLELIGDAGDYLKRKASVGELPDVTLISDNIYSQNYNEYFLPIDDLGFDEENMYNCKIGRGGDGKLYGLLTGLSIPCVIYNKDVFDEAGITSIPKNDEEFMEVCKKIKSINKIPITINFKCNWIMNTWLFTIPYLRKPDLENDVMECGEVLSKDGEIVKDLRLLKSIVKKGYCEDDFMNYEWTQCKSDFVNGKIGMILLSSDFVNQFTAMGMNEDSIGVFPFPESKIIIVGSEYSMGVSKTTKYPNEAKEFLKYLFDDSRYAEAIEITSSLKNNKETEKVLNDLQNYGAKIQLFEDKGDLVKRNDYYNLKVQSNLNWTVVQNFLTNDEQVVIDDINSRWKKGNPNGLLDKREVD